MVNLNNIFKPWMKNHPRAASSWEWGKIEEHDKKNYPIRHYLMEEILENILFTLKYKYKRLLNKHPFSERGDYLLTGLKRHNYTSSLKKILHATFKNFTDTVEMYKEDSLEFYSTMQLYSIPHGDYKLEEYSLNYKKSKLTQCFLYNWWVRDRPSRLDPLDDWYKRADLPKDFHPTMFAWAHDSEKEEVKQHKYYPLFLEWDKIFKESVDLNKEWDKEDTFMLKALISHIYSMEW